MCPGLELITIAANHVLITISLLIWGGNLSGLLMDSFSVLDVAAAQVSYMSWGWELPVYAASEIYVSWNYFAFEFIVQELLFTNFRIFYHLVKYKMMDEDTHCFIETFNQISSNIQDIKVNDI